MSERMNSGIEKQHWCLKCGADTPALCLCREVTQLQGAGWAHGLREKSLRGLGDGHTPPPPAKTDLSINFGALALAGAALWIGKEIWENWSRTRNRKRLKASNENARRRYGIEPVEWWTREGRSTARQQGRY